MEKTITIDGKDVRFRSSGATPLHYMNQFQSDYTKDIVKMGVDLVVDKDLKSMSEKEQLELVRQLDFNFFYRVAWTFAKTAEKSIPDPLTWLDGFDEFPIVEILPELQEMLLLSITTKKKSKPPVK